MNREEVKFLTCAETAKLVRAELKKRLPNQKVSVRSDTYAGGASIDISWDNGLPQSTVEKFVAKYSGAWFDGMIDLKNYFYHWLLPDGSIMLAYSEGTKNDIATEKPDSAIAVQFGADYIHCNRHLTEDLQRKIAEDISKIGDLKFDGDMSASFDYNNRWYDWWILCGRVSSTGNLDNYKGVKLVNGRYEMI